jgi:hypothetical protein
MCDPLLDQVRQVLGVPLGDVLPEVRRLKALELGLRAGAVVTPGMSPADVDLAIRAAAALAPGADWTSMR